VTEAYFRKESQTTRDCHPVQLRSLPFSLLH